MKRFFEFIKTIPHARLWVPIVIAITILALIPGYQTFTSAYTSIPFAANGPATNAPGRPVAAPQPHLMPGPDFTFAVVPDTQNEVQFAPAMVNSEFNWLNTNASALNLQAILQTGDVVNTEYDSSQWAQATSSFSIPSVTETVSSGNHDTEDYSGTTKPGHYTEDGAPFTAFIESLPSASTIAGRYQAGSDLNYYQTRMIGSSQWIFISLQFGAPAGPTEWAASIAAANPSAHVVILTHDFLSPTSTLQTRTSAQSAPTDDPSLQSPSQIWTELKGQSNIEFIFSGHVGTHTGTLKFTTGKLTLTGTNGNKVHAIMLNAQDDNNGDGWLRTLTFSPAKGTVTVTTYSPYLNKYATDSLDKYTIAGVKF